MKISQLTSDQAADVYLRIAPDLEEIAKDEKLKEIMNSRKPPTSKEEEQELGKVVVLKIAHHMLSKRRENVWNIIGAVAGKDSDEIAEQSFVQTMRQLVNLLTDKELIGFFTSVAQSVLEM